ncbi:MAG: hypothetical protein J6S85_22465, partial [Methanobrevibacter sp.]|nr:hypothetical protein [Methanobrevibacter sp.]
MRSKRIIGFSMMFILIFLLMGLNTACASNVDDLDYNLSDSLESSPVSNALDFDNAGVSEDSESNSISDSIDESSISNIDDSIEEISSVNTGSDSKIGDGEKTIHTITEDNYSSYFDSDGNLINSLVKANDTINLSGNFSNKKFVINIPLTITSTENNAILKNSPIYYYNVSNENFA